MISLPTIEEIYYVVKIMNPHKNPGLGGFARIFYQHYWDVIGQSIMDLV